VACYKQDFFKAMTQELSSFSVWGTVLCLSGKACLLFSAFSRLSFCLHHSLTHCSFAPNLCVTYTSFALFLCLLNTLRFKSFSLNQSLVTCTRQYLLL
jgi:hypothetical protein